MRRDSRSPKATLSKIDMGKGVAFWNTMPTRNLSSATSTVGRGCLRVEPHVAGGAVTRVQRVHAVEHAQER